MLIGAESLANWLDILRESLLSVSVFAQAKIPSTMKTFSWDGNVDDGNWVVDTLFSLPSIAIAQPEMAGAGMLFNTMFTKTAVPATIKSIEQMTAKAAREARQAATLRIAGEAEKAVKITMCRLKMELPP